MAKFQVNILGCGSATPTARHMPSCQVIDYRDKLMMIDCGEGAQMQFRKMGLKFSRLTHIFISHLHGDHLFGLPGLLSTMALHEVTPRVSVHVHEAGVNLLRSWFDFFLRDSAMEIIFDPIRTGETRLLYEDKSLEVSCFPLYHRIPSSGFIFREKPKQPHINGEMARFLNLTPTQILAVKEGADITLPDGRVFTNDRLTFPADPAMSYAYCSDTMADLRVARAIEGVDTVYHEATYDDSLAATARERGHSTAGEAARIALAAGAKRLILGHFSKRYDSEQILLDQASEIFPTVILANEGLRVSLEV